jgi:thymidylate kinase
MKLQAARSGPHELPPRSLPASMLKAMWWLFKYTVRYFVTVHPTRARGGVVLNHRYLLDAIVDRRRYRNGGPRWLQRAIWRIAPKPDLVIQLDAPPEVIQKRKQEISFEETARLSREYRALVCPLKFGHVVDASRPLNEVVAQVDEIFFSTMRDRVARRFASGSRL